MKTRMGDARRLLLGLVLLGAAAASPSGCGGSSSDCTPGKQTACACADGTVSAQVCGEDGTFGACVGCGIGSGSGGSSATSCRAYCDRCDPMSECTTLCTSGSASRCGAEFAAVNTCTASDGCSAPSCESAIVALATCVDPPPATGGGTLHVACNEGSSGVCVDEKGLDAASAASAKQSCGQSSMGTVVDACPTAGRIGCCDILPEAGPGGPGLEIDECYYATGLTTESQAVESCTQAHGTWHPE